MAIKQSSQKQIDALMRDLASEHDVARDAAIARLTVIGPRAVSRLSALVSDRRAAASARAAALRALEAIGDPHGLDPALRALSDADTAVAVAAVGVARGLFGSPRGVEAVDYLTSVALDGGRVGDLRRAAARALADLPASTVAPVFKALGADPDAQVAKLSASLASRSGTPRKPAARDSFERWTEGDTLEDPDGLRRALIADNGAGLPLTTLHRLVQRLREREDAERPAHRAGWTTARAAAHAALAARGSRIALYDLKETLEAAAEPLPVEFLTALTSIGDASCLEALAAAYAKAIRRRGDDWWRRHLLAAFHEIVRREKITSRTAVMKRVQKRWPQVLGVRDKG